MSDSAALEGTASMALDPPTPPLGVNFRKLALYSLCGAVLLVVLDSTVAVIALPSIMIGLRLRPDSTIWILNAYMLTYGGFLLFGGRIGDMYGRRRVFLIAIALFTLASLLCGISSIQETLLTARALQGFAGAVVSSVALSLIISIFPEPEERARPMAVYAFVYAAGSSIGDLLGGVLTRLAGWRWVFLSSVPLGLIVLALCVVILPRGDTPRTATSLDLCGALVITTAITLIVYLLATTDNHALTQEHTTLLICLVGLLRALFVAIELHAPHPLVPFRLFSSAAFTTASMVILAWAAVAYAWFAMAALHLQRALGYNALQVGLAFLPNTIALGAFSLGMADKMITRFGLRRPIWLGLLLFAGGLIVFATLSTHSSFLTGALPGMLLIGLADAIVSTPLLVITMRDIDEPNSGLASGVINTLWVVGGTVGLTALLSLANAHANQAMIAGVPFSEALNGGYRFAYVISAIATVATAILAGFVLPSARVPSRIDLRGTADHRST